MWTVETQYLSAERKAVTGNCIIYGQGGEYIATVPDKVAGLIVEAPAMVEALRDFAHGAFATSYDLDDPAQVLAIQNARAILSRIDGAGEAPDQHETGCASCGAPEGESHAGTCETRGFAMGTAARRGDTLPDAPVPAPTGEAKPHLFTVIWGNIGDDNGKRLDHVSVESADQNLIMDAAFECFFKDLERSGQTLTAEDREEFRHNTAYDGYAVLPGHVTDAPGMGFF